MFDITSARIFSDFFPLYENGKKLEGPYEGKEFSLECTSNDNWKSCSWKRLSLDDSQSCNFTYQQTSNDTKQISSKDSASWEIRKSGCGRFFGFAELKYRPGAFSIASSFSNEHCTIQIKEANRELSGDWECELQRCNSRENEGCKSYVLVHLPNEQYKLSFLI